MRKLLIVLMIVAVIIVAGCTGGDKTTTGKSYVGGSNGLSVEYEKDNPPDKVFDANSEDFFINVKLKNLGEYDVEKNEIKVTLSGIDKTQFQISDLTKVNTNSLLGMRKEGSSVINGMEDIISYKANYKTDLGQDFFPTITANICYRYQTKSLTNICLRRTVIKKETVGECLIDAAKSIENSGAPVQVKSVSERKAGKNLVAITFEIQNVGKGKVYKRGTFNTGNCGEIVANEGFVNVEVKPTTNIAFKCSNFNDKSSGEVKLNSEGKAMITCEASTLALQESSFEDPLNINLDFVYKEIISKQITVQNAA